MVSVPARRGRSGVRDGQAACRNGGLARCSRSGDLRCSYRSTEGRSKDAPVLARMTGAFGAISALMATGAMRDLSWPRRLTR